MYVSTSKTVKDAPIGVASLFAFAIVALCCILFQLMQSVAASPLRWVAAFLIVVAYLLYSPAVAGTLYSVLFEQSKALALAALALAGLTVLTMPSSQMLDGLVFLPFWFLGIMGVVKFVRWRRAKKIPANVPEQNR